MLIPTLRDADLVGLEGDLRTCISNKLLGNSNVAVPGTTLPQNSSLRQAPSQDCLKQFSICFWCCFSKGINPGWFTPKQAAERATTVAETPDRTALVLLRVREEEPSLAWAPCLAVLESATQTLSQRSSLPSGCRYT